MYIIFSYEDERWVSSVRKNAYGTNRDRCCAIAFPTSDLALSFCDILTSLYGGVFSVFCLDEVK